MSGSGFQGLNGCPGMMKCSIIATSTQPDKMCECCDIGPPLDDRNEGKGASARMIHLLDLRLMIEVGCTFAPNDLVPWEWEGLQFIRIEQNLRESEAIKEREAVSKFKPEFLSRNN